jgi:hypothetical protein
VQHTRRRISYTEILVEWADNLKMRLLEAFRVKNRLGLSSVVLFLEAPTVPSNIFRFCIIRVSSNIVTAMPQIWQ